MKKGEAVALETPWLNPLRWDDRKNTLVFIENKNLSAQKWLCPFDAYALGSYETFLNLTVPASYNLAKDMYWDRTFISAYVYHSISRAVFDFCVERLFELNRKFMLELVLVDTSVDACLERLNNLRELSPNYKDYIWADNKVDMMRVQQRFYEVMGTLSERNGFVLHTI